MNALMSLYLSRNGRLGRVEWWIAIMGLLGASVIVKLVLSLVGIGVWPMTPIVDPMHPDAMIAAIRASSLGGAVTLALLAYPGYCVSLKRQHDRDKSGLSVIVVMALGLAALLVNVFADGFMVFDLELDTFVLPPLWSIGVSTVFGLFGLYVVAMVGLKAGTEGDNRYGPPPAKRDWMAA